MLVQTDYSLFSSALTVKKAVSAGEEYVVLCDNNLFAVPTFVYECRSQNKKPIVGLQKEIGEARYLFIALNDAGYHTLVEYESLGFKDDVFSNNNILTILVEVLGEKVKPVKYALITDKEYEKKLLSKFSEVFVNARIINGEEDTDIYTVGLVKAIGEGKGFDETVIQVNFNNKDHETCDNCIEIKDLISGIEDYFSFGNPTPPEFKFREEVSSKYGIQTSNDQELFEFLCMKGLNFRFKELNIPESERQTYLDRLSFEMNVIKNMKFPGYMLIVWDFVNYAKSVKVPVGPGRGSAAGSLVAFALRITNIDPIKYGLLFERFLNPDRVSFPDIDMDFAQEGRGQIIDYVSEKYGKECVAQVITFGKIGAKSAIRDIARVYRAPLYVADKIAKSISDKPGTTLDKALKEDKDFWENWRKEDFVVDKILNGSIKVTGMTRNLGVHAAGLIIGTVPIYKKAPLYTVGDAQVVGFDGKYLEDVDLVKFDFLGLKTLDVIDNAIKFVKEQRGEVVDFNKVDIEDKGTYEFIKKGNNLGVFQIESAGMRGLAKSLQPDRFEEIIAMLALFRPGPMEAGMLESFIERKHGREEVNYFFDSMTEALKPILEPTYGLIVYQEQVMQIVQAIAGFSLGEADLVRRAMGKKKAEEMERISKDFAEGAVKKGYKREEAIELFHLIEKFAGYGFNKSHSAAYAMVTFQTAYLKTYYPLEFFTALLNSEIGDTDKIAMYISEAKELGIEIIQPDITICSSEFKIVDGKIAFGLKSVKGVGSGAETLIHGIEKHGCDLVNLLKHTQMDKDKEIASLDSKIRRLEKSILTIDKNIDKSNLRISNLNEKKARKGSLTPREEESILTHEAKIREFINKIDSIKSEIFELKKAKEDLSGFSSNVEKVNKRVFEALSSVGAFNCFGVSRKFLVENTVALLNPKTIDKVDFSTKDQEYSKAELMKIEEELMGVIMNNPFSVNYSEYDIPDDCAIAIILDKVEKRKKDGSPYVSLKLLLHNMKIMEISDFNNKSKKFDIGSEIDISFAYNGKYINLRNLTAVKKDKYPLKTKESVELEITVLDPIPEDLTEVDSIKVYDLNGELIAILS